MVNYQDHAPTKSDDVSPPSRATVVIGLGNPLRGDDGVGGRVVQTLATRALPRDVEVVDGGTRGLGIINLLEGRQRAIFVDAAEMGKIPGQFVRFSLDAGRLLGEEAHLSVHAAGLRDALLLAQALDALPEEVVIFAVQPANLAWTSELSPDVEATLPNLIADIVAEIEVSHQPSEISSLGSTRRPDSRADQG